MIAKYKYKIEHSSPLVKRSLESQSEDTCPGTCVHSSQTKFCEEVLIRFSCPLNGKCCIKRSTERAFPTAVTMECTGQCLPSHMQQYCLRPNELIFRSSCSRGTICCMRRFLTTSHTQIPSVNRVPNSPLISGSHASDILEHLAVDEAGTVYKVDMTGQNIPSSSFNSTGSYKNGI
ncbi:protein masquerade [Caerostris extrusa]|uniref:Protein masquerade n=1 Tax=Caerostris extrusa TaxID=172846 RepID=A0AAV4RKE7_CAEEX|nr:protein masquerade [Caerostris extrusa]